LTDAVAKPKAVKLGYELSVELVKEPSGEDQLSLLNVKMQVVELDDKWVDGLEAVELDLIITPTDDFMIANVRNTKTTNPASGSGKQCVSVFCRFKQALKDRLSGLTSVKGKGCGKGAKKMGNPHGGPKKYGNQGHNGHKHNGHKHNGHRAHILARVMRGIKNVVIHIVLPLCLTIAVGLTAIFIGTFIFSTFVLIWRAVLRRGQSSSYERIGQEELAIEPGEKDPSMFKEDVPPPVYE